ncbi:hypothetical protein PIB30_070062 [Stylosanthes scabra]|uniref:Uncharacterized protein n=1 Tax=Stylosanthes scabra TaxID=79078 RepID=A0ABU6SNY0_9FABA|nr:hypothetical protein [Stylosanthes scabra]
MEFVASSLAFRDPWQNNTESVAGCHGFCLAETVEAFGHDILSHSDFCCASWVKYGCFSIEADEDLQVFFHCRRQFLEVRTTELFVEKLDPLASSGGFAPNPHSAFVAGPSCPVIQHDPEAHQVASPTFGIYHEVEAADCVGDLGDTRSFGEIADVVAVAPLQCPFRLWREIQSLLWMRHCEPMTPTMNHHSLRGTGTGTVTMTSARYRPTKEVHLVQGHNNTLHTESWKFFLTHLRAHVTPQSGILVLRDRHNGIKIALEDPA